MTKKFITPSVSGNLWGCRIDGYFFDPSVNESTNLQTRIFPFMPKELRKNFEIIISEKDKVNIAFGDIIAQPDGVFKFNYNTSKFVQLKVWRQGLVSVEYKSLSGYSAKRALHSADKWKSQIRIKDVLQCVITAMQVSVKYDSHTLPLLRYVNSAYAIFPSPELIQFIIDKAPKVKKYLEEERFVNSSQLAEHLSLEVEKLFKKTTNRSEKSKEDGALNHDKMFS